MTLLEKLNVRIRTSRPEGPKLEAERTCIGHGRQARLANRIEVVPRGPPQNLVQQHGDYRD